MCLFSKSEEAEVAPGPGVAGQGLRGGPMLLFFRKGTRGASLETGFSSDHPSPSQTSGRDEK